MAQSLGWVEDSANSCLLAGGLSTQLNMVVGDSWWPPSGSFILRPSITSSQVIFTNSQMACLNSLTLSANGRSPDSPADCTSLPSVEGTNNKLLSKGLAAALHPGRQVCLGGKPLYSDFGGLEVQSTLLLGTS